MEAVGDRYNAPLEYLQSTAAGIDGLPRPAMLTMLRSLVINKPDSYAAHVGLLAVTNCLLLTLYGGPAAAVR